MNGRKYKEQQQNTESMAATENMMMPGEPHKTVTERYYTPKYYTEKTKEKDKDICILTHSNKICIITLSKLHPIVKENMRIKNINFNPDGTNRLDNKVSGKGKHGAQSLGPKSKLCIITCENGKEYTIDCGIRSQLIEVNENLIENPGLLLEKPHSDGYIAIVLPKLRDYEQVMKTLLSEEEYLNQDAEEK